MSILFILRIKSVSIRKKCKAYLISLTSREKTIKKDTLECYRPLLILFKISSYQRLEKTSSNMEISHLFNKILKVHRASL